MSNPIQGPIEVVINGVEPIELTVDIVPQLDVAVEMAVPGLKGDQGEIGPRGVESAVSPLQLADGVISVADSPTFNYAVNVVGDLLGGPGTAVYGSQALWLYGGPSNEVASLNPLMLDIQAPAIGGRIMASAYTGITLQGTASSITFADNSVLTSAPDLSGYVLKSGAAMTGSLTWDNGTYDSAIGPDFFGVEDKSGNYAELQFNSVQVTSATGDTAYLVSTGVNLSNGTSLAKGSFDNGLGGYGGISLNCAVGYELNWQAGRLSSSYNAGAVKVPLVLDSGITLSDPALAITFGDSTVQTTAAVFYNQSLNTTDYVDFGGVETSDGSTGVAVTPSGITTLQFGGLGSPVRTQVTTAGITFPDATTQSTAFKSDWTGSYQFSDMGAGSPLGFTYISAAGVQFPDFTTQSSAGITATDAAATYATITHTHDASAIVSGTIDLARIPIIPSQVQVVSTQATIAALTSGEQAQITGAGVLVTLTDGTRWVYSGTGSKTSQASYVQLADITPDWSTITSKPAFGTAALANTGDFYPYASNPAGYLTSSALSGYATQSWVTSQGYITSAALAPYVLASSLGTAAYQNVSYFVRSPSVAGTDGQVLSWNAGTSLPVWIDNATGTVFTTGTNKTGATLTKGTVVYINGAQGSKFTLAKAQASGDPTSAQTLGVVQSDIANNASGNVITFGEISGIDTSAYADGTQLYLSPTTAGAFTSTKPSAPDHLVYVAIVSYSHAVNGKVLVKVQNGYELEELHNVAIASAADKDILAYESSTGLWKNKSFATLDLLTSATAASTYYAIPTGTTAQYIRGNGTLSTFSTDVIAAVPSASTSTAGRVQLATNTESALGTNSAKSVTPLSLTYRQLNVNSHDLTCYAGAGASSGTGAAGSWVAGGSKFCQSPTTAAGYGIAYYVNYFASGANALGTGHGYNSPFDWSKPTWVELRVRKHYQAGGYDANSVARMLVGGRSNATITTVGDLTSKGVGFSFAGTGNFIFQVHNGTALTTIDTGVAATGGGTYDIIIYSDGAGNVTMTIDGTQVASTALGPVGTGANLCNLVICEAVNNSTVTSGLFGFMFPFIKMHIAQ